MSLSPATCTVFIWLQDILGDTIGSTQNAVLSVRGGSFKYNQTFVVQATDSSNFNSSGFAQLTVIESQTPGVYYNFSIKYQIGTTYNQINFNPVIVPNLGAVSLSSIATIKESTA